MAGDRSGKLKLPHARFQNLDLAAERHFRGDPILAHHTIRFRGGRSLRVGCIIYDVSYTGWSEIHKFRSQSSVELVGRQGDLVAHQVRPADSSSQFPRWARLHKTQSGAVRWNQPLGSHTHTHQGIVDFFLANLTQLGRRYNFGDFRRFRFSG